MINSTSLEKSWTARAVLILSFRSFFSISRYSKNVHITRALKFVFKEKYSNSLIKKIKIEIYRRFFVKRSILLNPSSKSSSRDSNPTLKCPEL